MTEKTTPVTATKPFVRNLLTLFPVNGLIIASELDSALLQLSAGKFSLAFLNRILLGLDVPSDLRGGGFSSEVVVRIGALFPALFKLFADLAFNAVGSGLTEAGSVEEFTQECYAYYRGHIHNDMFPAFGEPPYKDSDGCIYASLPEERIQRGFAASGACNGRPVLFVKQVLYGTEPAVAREMTLERLRSYVVSEVLLTDLDYEAHQECFKMVPVLLGLLEAAMVVHGIEPSMHLDIHTLSSFLAPCPFLKEEETGLESASRCAHFDTDGECCKDVACDKVLFLFTRLVACGGTFAVG